MLSPESAAVVRSTLPAVGGALDEITTRFYGSVSVERPELLDGMTGPTVYSASRWPVRSSRSPRLCLRTPVPGRRRC
jgi:hypothetical protein